MSESAVKKSGRLIGYARVSTVDQDLDRQLRELGAAGCVQTFTDVESGAVSERPGLAKALAELVAGDTLVVTRLDRAGRSARGLLELANELQEREVHLRSLREMVDTSTAHGRLFFTLTSAFAEFEREVIIERTRSGPGEGRALRPSMRHGRQPQGQDRTGLGVCGAFREECRRRCWRFGIDRPPLLETQPAGNNLIPKR